MQRNFLSLFVFLLLGFSHVLYVSAVPATRTSALSGEDASVMPYFAQLLEHSEEMHLDMEEGGFMARRLGLETHDYGGTGENHDHDPNTG
ncbi:uncharacterized protein LOC130737872 [Lotus japonicus]|uniref:uncharacterized protein LOC130737872 n=1 Tax=Lotus japonicus TaxID=34305 RepID=UPI00258EE398|nr:uncharacterized protein LOC130737872 [Lotus japonicus]